MARSATETQRQRLAGSPLMAPAMDSSWWPRGVVGGSKQGAISMAGYTPMDTEMGRGPPRLTRALGHGPDVAAARAAGRWTTDPPWISLWMVTSEQPVSQVSRVAHVE